MRARWTLAGAAAALMVAACGQQASQRAAVAAYLRHVNQIERALARPLARVTTAGARFATEQRAGGTLTNLLPTQQEATLQTALAQVRDLRARLAALKAPPPTRRLRRLLLQIVDGQSALTREVAELVRFLPSYSSALRPLAPATRSLELALAQSTPPSPRLPTAYAAKAAALRQFKATVQGILRQLRGIHPPAVSKPDYHTEIHALEGMSLSAGELATALASGTQANIQPLLVQFDRAATSNQSIAAQKARIAAIRAYDAQSARLSELAQAAESERTRLADTLG